MNSEKKERHFLMLIVVLGLLVRISSHDVDISAFYLRRHRNGVFNLDLVARRKLLRITARCFFLF